MIPLFYVLKVKEKADQTQFSINIFSVTEGNEIKRMFLTPYLLDLFIQVVIISWENSSLVVMGPHTQGLQVH